MIRVIILPDPATGRPATTGPGDVTFDSVVTPMPTYQNYPVAADAVGWVPDFAPTATASRTTTSSHTP